MRRAAARAAAALAAALLLRCASALNEPPPVTQMEAAGGTAPSASPGSADGFVAEGERHFARRPDPHEVREAQRSFLAAAQADAARVDGLLGLARASSWLVEHEDDATARERLVRTALDAAQWCARRDPENPACDYALGQALGQQARERPSSSRDGLARMTRALARAATADPRLDAGGPDRVLALVYLRAPGWPLGPGDAEAGLQHAQRAVALAPDHPPNQLTLAEALAANGRRLEARAACEEALAQAHARAAAGDPDAAEWVDEAERGRQRWQ